MARNTMRACDLWVMRRMEPVPCLPSSPAASCLTRADHPWCPAPSSLSDRCPWRPYYRFYYDSRGSSRTMVPTSPMKMIMHVGALRHPVLAQPDHSVSRGALTGDRRMIRGLAPLKRSDSPSQVDQMARRLHQRPQGLLWSGDPETWRGTGRRASAVGPTGGSSRSPLRPEH